MVKIQNWIPDLANWKMFTFPAHHLSNASLQASHCLPKIKSHQHEMKWGGFNMCLNFFHLKDSTSVGMFLSYFFDSSNVLPLKEDAIDGRFSLKHFNLAKLKFNSHFIIFSLLTSSFFFK